MKRLASTILGQRNDTEHFFLESLQEVKEIIIRERKRLPVETTPVAPVQKTRGGSGGGKIADTKFPSINIKAANLHLLENNKAQVSHLTTGVQDQVSSRCIS